MAGFVSHAASALPIIGTDGLGVFNVSVAGNGTNLVGATSIFSSSNSGQTQATGGGDLSVVPTGSAVTFNTLFTTGVNGGNGGSEAAFSFTLDGVGTFTETANPLLISSNATGNSQGEDFYLFGYIHAEWSLVRLHRRFVEFRCKLHGNSRLDEHFL